MERGFKIVKDEHRKFLEQEIKIPHRSTKYSAGYDFYSNEDITLISGEKHVFWTDIKAYMKDDEVLKIHVRSSIGIKKGLILANSTGIIDCVPKGTKIKIIGGEKNVEDLYQDINIKILSYNEEINKIEEDEILEMCLIENKEVLKIETEEGDIIEIPYNKEVLTENGWKKSKFLTLNDKILKIA